MQKQLSIYEARYQVILDLLKKVEKTLNVQELLKKDILDVEEACRYLNISKSTLYKLTANHQIPFSKPEGKKIFLSRKSLDSWSMSNMHKPMKLTTLNRCKLTRQSGGEKVSFLAAVTRQI